VSRFGRFLHRVHDKVAGQVERSAKQFGNFNQRLVRGLEGYTHRVGSDLAGANTQFIQNIEHRAKKDFITTVKISPYITAVAAFIVNLIPVFGAILSLVVVAIGTYAARWTGYYAARYEGMTTQEARNYGRTMEHRNLIAGMIGSAIGGIFVALGIGLGTAAAETATTAGAEAGGNVSLMAGEGGEVALNTAAQAGDMSLEAEAAANVANTISSAGEFAPATNFAAEILPTNYALPEALGGSPGFLANAWSWITANPEKLVTGGYSLYQQVMAKLNPPQIPGMNFSFAGLGGGGRGGDPGGPGPGSGAPGGISWDNIAETAANFFDQYGEILAIALGLAVILVLFLR
jgi:hypothetical protein